MRLAQRATVATIGLILAVAATRADETPVAAPPGANQLNLDQYLTGTGTDRTGAFPGMLSCIKTKGTFAATTAEDCGDGRVYVVTLPDGVAVPLKAGTDPVLASMRNLLDQKVVVRGRVSTQTGVITATSVESARTAVEAPNTPAGP